MNLRAPAILVASRSHGETASIARMLTEEFGLNRFYEGRFIDESVAAGVAH